MDFALLITERYLFFQFLGGGTLFSLDSGLKGGSLEKPSDSVRGPISYKLVSWCIGGEGRQALGGEFFFHNSSLIRFISAL